MTHILEVEVSKHRFPRPFLTLLLAAALALFAAASAQDHDPNAVINLATNADPTMNPWAPGAVIESNLINTILFEQLTRYSPTDLSPSPALAERWEASEDALAWTFYLRDDVLWSDGDPFDADDVAFTFNDVVKNPELGAQSANQFAAVERVEVVDQYTVRFVLNTPFSALPYYLASYAGILPAHVLSDAENPLTVASFNKQQPVSTGPYKVAEYVSGSHVRMVPNENYYGSAPKLAGIVFRIIPDTNTQVAQLLAGQLDLVGRLNPTALAGVERNPALDVMRQSQNIFYFVALNMDDERFQDVRVRQALLTAIDRQALIDALVQGYGQVATGPIAPLLAALHNPDVEQHAYDPERAKALLAEAGWTPGADGVLQKDGQPFVIDMPTASYAELTPASLLIQQFWADVGVKAELTTIEWNAYIQQVILERDYEASVAWWSMPPTPDVTPYVSCSAAHTGNNIPNYCNEELDELLAAGRRALTAEEQQDAYYALQELLAVELPYLYLWHPDIISVKRNTLQGMPEINAATAFQHSEEWYVAR